MKKQIEKLPSMNILEKKYKRDINDFCKSFNHYVSVKGYNKSITKLIDKLDIVIENNVIISIKGKNIVSIVNNENRVLRVQDIKKVNKYNSIKATSNVIDWSIDEIKALFDTKYSEYFKVLRIDENGCKTYKSNIKIRRQQAEEFFMEIYGNSELLKGYANNDKQVNIGVFVEIFCKLRLGLNPNFSYNKCDIYITEKMETVEIKSNSYNPFSLNGEGRQEREFFPEIESIREYIVKNCKAKYYMIFEDRNPINALNDEYWKLMSKDEYIDYCIKNAKIDKTSQKNGGYPIIRVKSSLKEKM